MLYVEGGPDLDNLRALAERLGHGVAEGWDEPVNAFYLQDNFPAADMDSELERVEGAFGMTPEQHFFALRGMLPDLKGLAIRDSDGRMREDSDEGGLRTAYWTRYEVENYYVTPGVLLGHAAHYYRDMTLCGGYRKETAEVLDELIQERVFPGRASDFETWKGLDPEAARLLWEAATAQVKLSDFAEEFFRRLAERLNHAMLLRKGELHRLVDSVDPAAIPEEVSRKLDLLGALFDSARPGEES